MCFFSRGKVVKKGIVIIFPELIGLADVLLQSSLVNLSLFSLLVICYMSLLHDCIEFLEFNQLNPSAKPKIVHLVLVLVNSLSNVNSRMVSIDQARGQHGWILAKFLFSFFIDRD